MKETMKSVYELNKKGIKITIFLNTIILSAIPSRYSDSIRFETYTSLDDLKAVRCSVEQENDTYFVKFSKKRNNIAGVSLTQEQYNEIKSSISQNKELAYANHQQNYENLRNSYLSGENDIPLDEEIDPCWSPFAADIGFDDPDFEQIAKQHMVYVCREEVACQILLQNKLATKQAGVVVLNKELNGKVNLAQLSTSKNDKNNDDVDNIFEKHDCIAENTVDEAGSTKIYRHIFTANNKKYIFIESNLFDCGISITQISGDNDKTAEKISKWLNKHSMYTFEDIRM